jgi:hypothetical protein
MLAHDPATFAQRIGVPLEQAIATSARAGRLLLEGCQGSGNRRVRVSLLYHARQDRTGCNLHAERWRERRVRHPQTVARASRTRTGAIRPGEDSKCARAYRSMTSCGSHGCAERRSGPDRGCWRRARARAWLERAVVGEVGGDPGCPKHGCRAWRMPVAAASRESSLRHSPPAAKNGLRVGYRRQSREPAPPGVMGLGPDGPQPSRLQ